MIQNLSKKNTLRLFVSSKIVEIIKLLSVQFLRCSLNIIIKYIFFRGPDKLPTVHETRNCYPIQSKEELEKINTRLNYLIKSNLLEKNL